jgi:hypothetical protein
VHFCVYYKQYVMTILTMVSTLRWFLLKTELVFCEIFFADFKFPEVNARASSSEPVESGSDTDRDEARMAAEMVGGRTWLEGEWSASESETSGHQVGSQPNALELLEVKL